MFSNNCLLTVFAVLSSTAYVVSGQDLLADTGVAGPSIEVVHYYHGQWPTG